MPSVPRKAKGRQTSIPKTGLPKTAGSKKKEGHYIAFSESRVAKKAGVPKKTKASLKSIMAEKKNLPKGGKPMSPAGFRERELEWCQTHAEVLQAYTGQWVVLEGEEIIANGGDPAELVDQARSKGIPVPFVLYIEDLDPDVVRMGL